MNSVEQPILDSTLSVRAISPTQLHETVRAGQDVELIDVRTPVAFREVHVTYARNIPLD